MSGIIGTSHSKSKFIGRSADTVLAWCAIDGTLADSSGDWIRDSYNFDSVSDHQAGQYDFYFDATLVAQKYMVLATTDANNKVAVNNKLATYVRVLCRTEADAYADVGYCDVAILNNYGKDTNS